MGAAMGETPTHVRPNGGRGVKWGRAWGGGGREKEPECFGRHWGGSLGTKGAMGDPQRWGT